MTKLAGSVLLRRIGTTMSAGSTVLPNYVVANEYQNENKCIGEHSDSHSLFDAMSNESVIFSFNVSRDGVFCARPTQGATFADANGVGRGKKGDNWVLPVYAPENSIIIMGGHFQSQMVHCTKSHVDIIAEDCNLTKYSRGAEVRRDYLNARRYCSGKYPRRARDLVSCQNDCSVVWAGSSALDYVWNRAASHQSRHQPPTNDDNNPSSYHPKPANTQ